MNPEEIKNFIALLGLDNQNMSNFSNINMPTQKIDFTNMSAFEKLKNLPSLLQSKGIDPLMTGMTLLNAGGYSDQKQTPLQPITTALAGGRQAFQQNQQMQQQNLMNKLQMQKSLASLIPSPKGKPYTALVDNVPVLMQPQSFGPPKQVQNAQPFIKSNYAKPENYTNPEGKSTKLVFNKNTNQMEEVGNPGIAININDYKKVPEATSLIKNLQRLAPNAITKDGQGNEIIDVTQIPENALPLLSQGTFTLGEADKIFFKTITVPTIDEAKNFAKATQTYYANVRDLVEIGKGLEGGTIESIKRTMRSILGDSFGEFANNLTGVNDVELAKAQAFEALQSKLIPTMRAPGSGTSSDLDIKMFTNALPSLLKSQLGRQAIVEIAEVLRNRAAAEASYVLKQGIAAVKDPTLLDATKLNAYSDEVAKRFPIPSFAMDLIIQERMGL